MNKVDGLSEDTDPSKIHAPKHNAKGVTNKIQRRCTQPIDESLTALSSIVESFKKIANAVEIQATLDMPNHINWQLVLAKLQGMKINNHDIKQS